MFPAVGSFGWVIFGLVLGWVVSAYSDRIRLFLPFSDCIDFSTKSYMRAFSQERSLVQGRRRVFKSGPAQETIECRRETREGDSPSRKGGLEGLPLDFF